MIKLLIVDDSALMRRQLTMLFEAEPDFEVRSARNGLEAVQENLEFEPDVMTLDINMPAMDGLTALSVIMQQRPLPVVMISSLTEKGALATFEALNLGAVDYVVKPGGTISLSITDIAEQVVDKVRAASRARLKQKGVKKIAAPVMDRALPESSFSARRANIGEGLVVIGVSTGGPSTLEMILPTLPADFPWPVVVAQHMPGSFTQSFANRMNDLCALQVVEANKPMTLEAGTIYIGKGGADVLVVRRNGKLSVIPKPENTDFLWHPSVELLGRSALEHVPATQLLGVMLTGMGSDGAAAFAEIKKRGGRTIAESEDSAVVFGMPAELIKRGGASMTLHAEKIGTQINSWLPG
ncbi:chemotaxis-specific protein-glutamate methyltransferase CheB [Herbaspirillum sp. RTI4]|uniref:chemotaxis-specific protein-glutamate methyltransferase CheB n=1 Tax=Herbaspirillum sp. RTI4 TaxID=3048640 RepID=UPI002AB5AC32|nr:chemotaxis-specific protein-glutamate methyltransferase CheB [Herbaspirillum sp. RTI4]MDY7579169.1 chemotaxis-specific protein-glutamate methyltransferase CheB [Herbaspirillum sp. RTI4]MEA9981252.1 chemotaxis-specific protein-glutamate methyltransferase CheB [Herbaspirillum sp. RTI4]